MLCRLFLLAALLPATALAGDGSVDIGKIEGVYRKRFQNSDSGGNRFMSIDELQIVQIDKDRAYFSVGLMLAQPPSDIAAASTNILCILPHLHVLARSSAKKIGRRARPVVFIGPEAPDVRRLPLDAVDLLCVAWAVLLHGANPL